MEGVPGNLEVSQVSTISFPQNNIFSRHCLKLVLIYLKNISLKADFEEAWPTIQQLYEEIDSSAMEGTGMTKLFQTLLNSVPPELVRVIQQY